VPWSHVNATHHAMKGTRTAQGGDQNLSFGHLSDLKFRFVDRLTDCSARV
jgi:hypothetical protein